MRAFLAWMRQWFRDAAAAATKPKTLRAFSERGLGAAFAHLAMLTLVFWVLPFSIDFFIGARDGIAALDEGLRTRVAAGTTFELKDGKLSNSLRDPLVVRDAAFSLIVNTASSTLDLAATETGIVVTSGGVFQQDGVHRESVSFATAPPFKVSREDIQAKLAGWAPFALFVGSLLVLLIVFSVLQIGFALSAAFHALAFWLALRIWKRAWHWKRAFVAAAYAATGPFILQGLLTLGGSDFSIVSTLLYWGLMGWLLYDVIRSTPPGKDGSDERKKEGSADDRPRQEGAA